MIEKVFLTKKPFWILKSLKNRHSENTKINWHEEKTHDHVTKKKTTANPHNIQQVKKPTEEERWRNGKIDGF